MKDINKTVTALALFISVVACKKENYDTIAIPSIIPSDSMTELFYELANAIPNSGIETCFYYC